MKIEHHPQAAKLILDRLQGTKAPGIFASARSRGARAMLFAGSVRDALKAIQDGSSYSPRDIDIGVQGMIREDFDRLLRRFGGQPNRYNGYLVADGSGNDPKKVPMDVWRLEETWGLQVLGLPFTLENTLRTFVLDLNAVAFDPESSEFYDLGSRRALQHQTIDLVNGFKLHSHALFAARALVLAERFGFSLTPRLDRFVRSHYDQRLAEREYTKHGRNEIGPYDATTKHRSFHPPIL